MSRIGTSPSAVRVVTYQSCPSSARLRSMLPCTKRQATARASDRSTITRTSGDSLTPCRVRSRLLTALPSGSAIVRVFPVIGFAAHGVAPDLARLEELREHQRDARSSPAASGL